MCRPNKALHLSGFIKTKHVVLGLIGEQISFLRKKRGEKGRKSRVCKEEWLGLALLLIPCSKETKHHTRRDLKRFKVRKIKTLTSYFDLDYGEKP